MFRWIFHRCHHKNAVSTRQERRRESFENERQLLPGRQLPNQYDTAETAILLEGFSTGFPIHYDGPQGMRHSSNHQSALQAATIVEQKLRHEIRLGRVAGPFQEIPFPNFQRSPLGLVPKHDPGKFRLIHDLSFPKGDSINFYTSKEFTTVQYESLDRVVELVMSCGPRCLIAKADIQEAFRLIPIRPQDYPLLGFTWQGMTKCSLWVQQLVARHSNISVVPCNGSCSHISMLSTSLICSTISSLLVHIMSPLVSIPCFLSRILLKRCASH